MADATRPFDVPASERDVLRLTQQVYLLRAGIPPFNQRPGHEHTHGFVFAPGCPGANAHGFVYDP